MYSKAPQANQPHKLRAVLRTLDVFEVWKEQHTHSAAAASGATSAAAEDKPSLSGRILVPLLLEQGNK